MTKFKNIHQNTYFTTNRVIFQNTQGASIGETLPIQESENLNKVSQTVKESYTARLELKEGVDKKVEGIGPEMELQRLAVKKLIARKNNGE